MLAEEAEAELPEGAIKGSIFRESTRSQSPRPYVAITREKKRAELCGDTTRNERAGQEEEEERSTE